MLLSHSLHLVSDAVTQENTDDEAEGSQDSATHEELALDDDKGEDSLFFKRFPALRTIFDLRTDT